MSRDLYNIWCRRISSNDKWKIYGVKGLGYQMAIDVIKGSQQVSDIKWEYKIVKSGENPNK